MLLGVLVLSAAIFGYLGLSNWMAQYSDVYSIIMYISSILYFMPIVHIVFFAEQSSVFTTDEARDVVLEFQKKTMITVYIGYIALIVFAAAVSLFNKAVIKINA